MDFNLLHWGWWNIFITPPIKIPPTVHNWLFNWEMHSWWITLAITFQMATWLTPTAPWVTSERLFAARCLWNWMFFSTVAESKYKMHIFFIAFFFVVVVDIAMPPRHFILLPSPHTHGFYTLIFFWWEREKMQMSQLRDINFCFFLTNIRNSGW